jgi:hypothetical protein
MKLPVERRAFVIGIDNYSHGLPKLSTARADARAVARVLIERQQYRVELLLDPSLDELRTLFAELASDALSVEHPRYVGERDRVVVRFASHGIKQPSEQGPTGFLAPATAQLGVTESYLPMDDVTALLGWGVEGARDYRPGRCHHLLLILDCCFAGAPRWSATRELGSREVVYRQRFRRFLAHPAHQMLASATARQVAADQVFGNRDGGSTHSPFASALLAALDHATPHDDGWLATKGWFREGVATAAATTLGSHPSKSPGHETARGEWGRPTALRGFPSAIGRCPLGA